MLAGPLPTEIGQLSRLTSLWVFVLPTADMIAIPSEVTLLSNIRALALNGIATPSDAWLTEALLAMTALTALTLYNDANVFGHDSSILPTQIGRHTALEIISLVNAGLTGTLPTELALLTTLTSLELWWNHLSGTIPTELGLLTDLVVLDLSENTLLTGFVPSEIGALTNLSVANFAFTRLSQQIPPQVCALGLEVSMTERIFDPVVNEEYDVGLIDACN
jgi:hypothetical protein